MIKNKNLNSECTLSIVAVSFERLGELKVFVQSVINQTHKNWRLHVLHDGQNDDFCNIMENYRRDHPVQTEAPHWPDTCLIFLKQQLQRWC